MQFLIGRDIELQIFGSNTKVSYKGKCLILQLPGKKNVCKYCPGISYLFSQQKFQLAFFLRRRDISSTDILSTDVLSTALLIYNASTRQVSVLRKKIFLSTYRVVSTLSSVSSSRRVGNSAKWL